MKASQIMTGQRLFMLGVLIFKRGFARINFEKSQKFQLPACCNFKLIKKSLKGGQNPPPHYVANGVMGSQVDHLRARRASLVHFIRFSNFEFGKVFESSSKG